MTTPHGPRLTGIFIAPDAGAPMTAVDRIRAVEGRGLEGDRYFHERGSFSRWPGSHRAVTLIAEEDLAELEREAGIVLPAAASRRNLLVRGVPLADLLHERFTIGEAEFEGARRCQPCKYLVRKTGVEGLIPHLVNRGGLRARIVRSGALAVGDGVVWQR